MADESQLSTNSEPAREGGADARSGTADTGRPPDPQTAREDAAPAEENYAAPELERTSDDASTEDGQAKLESILEIPVKLSMEIGQTKISIRNLLQLTRGSVVEFDKEASEPLDVMVNGVLVAHGEVVVVNEKFGVRLTDVVSTRERVDKLA